MHPGDIPAVHKPLAISIWAMFSISAPGSEDTMAKHSTAREVIIVLPKAGRIAIGLITTSRPTAARPIIGPLSNQGHRVHGCAPSASLLTDSCLYCELERTSRGYCKALSDLVTETPKQTADGEDNRVLRPSSGADHPARTGSIGSGLINAGNRNEKNLCKYGWRLLLVILNWNGCDMLRSFLPLC